MIIQAGEETMNKNIIRFKISIINLVYMVKKLFKSDIKIDREFLKKKRNLNKPLFSGSFIQKWYAKDFTLERWIDELQMVKDVGIDEIILQSVVDTKNKYAVYPTVINGYSASEKDMILLALVAAKRVGIKVRVGLGENDDWWEKGWYDFNWLSEEAQINKKIASEIFDKYSHHEAFGGWYIPHEFSEFFCTTKLQQTNLNLFYNIIASEIKSKNRSFTIMLAPFFNSNKYKIGSLELWSKIVQNVLINTEIDIVSLQDSIGAGFNTIDNIGEVFYYTRKATDLLGITLYADTETFISTEKGNVPATQEEIFIRMSQVSPYVEGFIAFSINHFQSKHVVNQINNYKAYLKYYYDVTGQDISPN